MCFATGLTDCPQSNRKEWKHQEQKNRDILFQKFKAINRPGLPTEFLKIFLSCLSEDRSQVGGLRTVTAEQLSANTATVFSVLTIIYTPCSWIESKFLGRTPSRK